MTDRTNYAIHTTILKVEQGKQRVHLSGSGEAALFTTVSLGWFVTFEGSYESLFFGNEKPEFAVGDKIKITFERIDNAKPSPTPIE